MPPFSRVSRRKGEKILPSCASSKRYRRINAKAMKMPGFLKKEPSVVKNSTTKLRLVTTGPSAAGRGSTKLCQQLNAKNNPATANKVIDQARGMFPELKTKAT